MPYQIGPQVMPERMEDMSPLSSALQGFNQSYGQMLRNRYQQELDKMQPQTMQAQLQSMQLGNQAQQMTNQYLPQSLQEHIAHMKMMDSYTPLLTRAKLMSAENASMTPVQRAYEQYKQAKPNSQDSEVYAAQLRSLLQPKAGTTISMPDGQTISMGGAGSSAGLPSFLMPPATASNHDGTTSVSSLQKGGRGNAGMLITKRDAKGNVIDQSSAQTNKNLTQNQQAAQALQLVSHLLGNLSGLTEYNYPGGTIKEKFDEILNHSGDTQPQLQNKILSESTLAQIQDSLGNAFNVPKTSEGFKFIQDAVKPLPGERSDQFIARLKRYIIPELSNRYAMTRNTLINGVPLPQGLSFKSLASSKQSSSPFSSITMDQIQDYAKRNNRSVAEVIAALKKRGAK